VIISNAGWPPRSPVTSARRTAPFDDHDAAPRIEDADAPTGTRGSRYSIGRSAPIASDSPLTASMAHVVVSATQDYEAPTTPGAIMSTTSPSRSTDGNLTGTGKHCRHGQNVNDMPEIIRDATAPTASGTSPRTAPRSRRHCGRAMPAHLLLLSAAASDAARFTDDLDACSCSLSSRLREPYRCGTTMSTTSPFRSPMAPD